MVKDLVQSKSRQKTKKRRMLAGFGVAPVLYMLGLVGVGAGVLFSGYSQSLRNNIALVNSIGVKNDLESASATMAATSVLGNHEGSPVLCPPGVSGETDSDCPSSTPVSLLPIPTTAATDARFPKPPSGALETYVTSGTNPPAGVGTFLPTAGMKQVDPWGHHYVVCRWNNPPSSSSPAFQIISGGASGVVSTKCGETPTTSSGNFSTLVNAATAVNRASVWQVTSTGTTTTEASYSATGVKVDSNGNMTIPGNLTLTGSSSTSLALSSASVTLGSGSLSMTDGSLTLTNGGVTLSNGNVLLSSGNLTMTNGALSASSGSFRGALSAATDSATGPFSVDGAGNLSIGSSVFTVASATGETSIMGAVAVGSTVTIGTSTATEDSSINTYGGIHIATTVMPAGTSAPFLSVGKGTGSPLAYLFSVDQYGGVIAGEVAASGVTASGSVSAGSVSAGTATISGALTANSVSATTVSGTTVTGGTVTATGALGGATAGISGNATIGGNLTVTGTINGGTITGVSLSDVTGVLGIDKGGTGKTTAQEARENLGTHDAGNLTTGILPLERLRTSDISNNGGPFNQVHVDVYGRVTSATFVPASGISDGTDTSIVAGEDSITFTIGGTTEGYWTNTGLTIGSSSPARVSLDLGRNTDALIVPIGTTGQEPSSPVAGMFRYNTTTGLFEGYQSGGWASFANSATASQWITSGNDIYYTTGKVGIGTNAPVNTLDVTGTGIHFSNGTPSATTNNLYSVAGALYWNGLPLATGGSGGSISGTANYIPLFTSSTTIGDSVMYQSGGNIGIGTTAPGYLLDIQGTTNDAVRVYTRNNSSGSGAFSAYTLGNDANSIAGGISLNSSTRTGYGGASALNLIQVYAYPLAFGTNNIVRMLIDGSGNVGIGTTAPAHPLDVSGTWSNAQISVGLTGQGGRINFVRAIDGTEGGWVGAGALSGGSFADSSNAISLVNNRGTSSAITLNSSGVIQFLTNVSTWTETMRITAPGYVGIGTTSPVNALDIGSTQGLRLAAGTPTSTTYALYNVGGTLYWNGTALGTGGGGGTVTGTGTANYVARWTDTSVLGTGVLVDTGTAVGIGTAAPSGTLTVYSTTDSSPIEVIGDGMATATSVHAYSYGTVAGNGGFFVGGYARGSYASPTAVQAGDRLGGLVVAGYSGSAFSNVASVESFVGSGTISSSSLPSFIVFRTTPDGSVARVERVRIDQNGNVGIGTTAPSNLFTVSASSPVINLDNISAVVGSGGVIKFGDSQSGSTTPQGQIYMYKTCGGACNTADMRFQTATSNAIGDKMVLTGAGNVGIGTTAPLGRLTVGSGNSAWTIGTTDVAAGAWLRNDGSNPVISTNVGNMYYGYSGNTKTLYFMGGGTSTQMTLTGSNGYVGIGSATPVNALDIGSTQGIRLASGTPASTTYALYNAGGTLYWNGYAVNTAATTPSTVPSFQAHLSASQSVSGLTKIQFNTENYDTNNNYDPTTNYRFTPTVAGKYLLTFSYLCAAGGSSGCQLGYIYKNGAAVASAQTGATAAYTGVVTSIIDMNGSTDYVEAYINAPSATSASSGNSTYFTGSLLGGASGSSITGTGTTNYLARWTGTSVLGTGLIVDTGTGVSIGTTTANAKFSIANNLATDFLDAYSEYQMILWDGGTAAGSYGLGVKTNTMVFNSGAGAYSFDRTGAATTMYMSPAGYVGIGTVTPSYPVDVYSSNPVVMQAYGTGVSTVLSLENSTGRGWRIASVGSGSGIASAGYFGIQDHTAVATRFVIDTSGNVGIGTTLPTVALDVLSNLNNSARVQITNPNTGTSAAANFVAYNDAGSLVQMGLYGANRTPVGSIASGDAYLHTTSSGLVLSANNASGVIKFSTGTGVLERMRIDASGNVGIGTTAPAAAMHVYSSGSTSTRRTVGIQSPSGTQTHDVLTIGGYSGSGYNLLNIEDTNSGTLGSGTSRLVVKAGGNVGIGTSTPANVLDIGTGGGIHITAGTPTSTSAALYNVGGTLYWNGAALGSGGSLSGGTTNYVARWLSETSLGTGVLYDNGTNVGIGTASPASLVNLYGLSPLITMNDTGSSSAAGYLSANTASGYAYVQLGNNRNTVTGTIPNSGAGTALIYTLTANAMSEIHFATSGTTNNVQPTDRLVINSSGNVGIGTTTVTYPLTVIGSNGTQVGSFSNTGTGIGVYGGSTSGVGVYGSTGSASMAGVYGINSAVGNGVAGVAATGFGVNGSGAVGGVFSGTTYGLLVTSGNVGIGTTAPTALLHVAQSGTGNYYLKLGDTAAGVNRFVVDGSGNVGVGTTSPVNALDIGSTQGLRLAAGTPTSTAYALYNVAGTLYWNGTAIGSGGGFTGGGTANYVARWTDTSVLGTGVLVDTGTAVGIGTTSPVGNLDILNASTSLTHGLSLLQYSDGVNGQQLNLYKSRGTATSPSAVLSGDLIGGIYYRGYDGTTAWSSSMDSRAAQIYSAAAENWTSSAHGANLYFGVTPTGTTSIATAMTISSAGNVGIGTTAPSVPLQVSTSGVSVADFKSTGANSYITLTDSGGTAEISSASGALIFGGGAAQSIVFRNNAYTNRMIIDSTGNVGIGTTVPTQKLDVRGNVNLGGATSNTIFFGTTGVAAPGAGSVGEKIQLYGTAGTIAATDYAIGVEGSNLWFNTNGGMKWYVGSAVKMVMDSSGNIGIGSATPALALDVVGGIKATTRIYAGGYYATGAGYVNAPSIEVGGAAPTGTSGQATIFFHHHGNIAHQLRYASSTFYFEAAGNGYGTSTTPNLSVGGSVRPGSTGVTTGAACTAGEGALAYDATAHAPVYCSNTGVWTAMGGGVAQGTFCGHVTWSTKSNTSCGAACSITQNISCNGTTLMTTCGTVACPSGYTQSNEPSSSGTNACDPLGNGTYVYYNWSNNGAFCIKN